MSTLDVHVFQYVLVFIIDVIPEELTMVLFILHVCVFSACALGGVCVAYLLCGIVSPLWQCDAHPQRRAHLAIYGEMQE